MSEETVNLAATALGRSNLHGFLATVFREELSPEAIRRIRSPEYLEALTDAGVVFDTAFLETPEERLAEDLAVEFTHLFVGPGGHISPHESVQRKGASGRLMGAETAAVRRFIEEAGFTYDPDFHGIPDHLSVELDFMQELTRLEGEAWESDDRPGAIDLLERQRSFMANHLLQWVFTFCGKVEESAGLPFYAEMARLAAGFMRAEEHDIPDRLKSAAADQAT